MSENGERTCDLAQLENGVSAGLVDAELPAGDYTQLRLTVVAATLYFGGPVTAHVVQRSRLLDRPHPSRFRRARSN